MLQFGQSLIMPGGPVARWSLVHRSAESRSGLLKQFLQPAKIVTRGYAGEPHVAIVVEHDVDDPVPLSGRALEGYKAGATDCGQEVEFLVVAAAKGECLALVEVERPRNESVDQTGRRIHHSADRWPTDIR